MDSDALPSAPDQQQQPTRQTIRDYSRDGPALKPNPVIRHGRGSKNFNSGRKAPYRPTQRTHSSSSQYPTDRKPNATHLPTISSITGIQGYPIRKIFTIFTTTQGLELLCTTVFNSIRGRDSKFTQSVTLEQFKYITFLCFANRLIQCGLCNGYQLGIVGASELRTAAKDIQLPEVVARYIEVLGLVKLNSGITVAPQVPRYFSVGSIFVTDPRAYLSEGGRDVDNLPVHFIPIDYDWIIAWNQNTTRPSRLSMHFRSVELGHFEGRNELLVSYNSIEDQIKPFAPQMMSEQELQLGAAYMLRQRDEGRDQPNTELLYGTISAKELIPELVIEHETTRSFTSM